jgi:DNA-binding NarL/FixJ family response regulator
MTKIRVLLADDHELVRAGIRNALNELSHLEVVGEVGDGPTLFTALARLQPDFLLIDVARPDFAP